MVVLYEDNHIIVVNKQSGEIVQGDKTGDRPLSEIVKDYIKEKYQKPGAVFLGVVHRLDRPVGGLVVFARTSKALARLNKMFAEKEQVRKTYWAIVEVRNEKLEMKNGNEEMKKCCERNHSSFLTPHSSFTTITHWLVRNEKQNKSYAYSTEKPNSKKAILKYRMLAKGDNYNLLEVQLLTGRHHQIRCQLSTIGYPIKGDLKYGAKRSNPDGSISLQSHRIEFVHPVSKETISIEAPVPNDPLWKALTMNIVKGDR